MIEGHGDDAYKYKHIRINFSSNVCNFLNHDGLRDYLCQHMDGIRTYPEPVPYSLERKLAEYLSLSAEEVCVTAGATEAIYLTAQAFRGHTSVVLMPAFSEYADACRLHGHRVMPVYSLNRLPEDARLVWLCNPNNPTGGVYEKGALRMCIGQHPQTLFVIDQSYEYFTLKSLFAPREAAVMPNVILLHSMTKRFAVPGLRLGYMTAGKELLDIVRRQRMPWSVSQLAMEAGKYLLGAEGEYAIDIPLLMQEKERLAQALTRTGGLEVWPSDTHYMLVRMRSGKAAALKEYLANEHGILIRDASNFEGLDEHFFRVAIQTPAENDSLVEGIRKWNLIY